MNKLNRYSATTYEYKKEILKQNKKINEQEQKIQELNNKIDNLSNDNKHLNEIIDLKNMEIMNMVNSKSWNLTKPLRFIMKKLNNANKFKVEETSSTDVITKKTTDEYRHDYKNLKSYDSFYQSDEDYSDLKTDIKALAFYLPQFHRFKENDEWWGKGFMEWTNTKKAKPHFEGHYQPREPHDDIGYYTLDNIETIKKQVELAKRHGIYGFCFYYYWFSGKRLMEKPVDLLLEHPEIDFPFCLCWANENWSRTWDGSDNDILIKQNYSKDDHFKFINDIKKYINDKRYIKVDGKPIILIYNPTQIPDLEDLIKDWRKCALEIGIGELLIWTKNDLARDDFKNMEFSDAEFDFAPNGIGHPGCMVTGLDTSKAYDYTQMVSDIEHLYIEHFTPKPFYYSCTMGWDNSARRKENYKIYYSYSLNAFYKWLRTIIYQTRYRNPEDRRFIFINAWNEWAEGTYLEPDKKYGYANINTLSRALFDLTLNTQLKITNNESEKLTDLNKKIAIQIHVFYTDLMNEIINNLNKIPYKYDLFISTDSVSKVKEINNALNKKINNALNIVVENFDNRGRDVLPFLLQMKDRIKNYDYICHLHTKKSNTVSYGDEWRKNLYFNLFGSVANIQSIFYTFENNSNIGIIYPKYYKEILNLIGIGGNKDNLNRLLDRINITKMDNYDDLLFPAGTMFWAKVDALMPLFSIEFTINDFLEEKGQIDGTMAHAIERSLCLIAHSQGYDSLQIINKCKEE